MIWRRLTLVVNVKDPNDVVLGETKGMAMRIEVFAARGAHIGDLRKKTAFEVREENEDVLCAMVQALAVVVTGAREARGAGVLAGDAVVLRTIWRRRLVCC